MEKRGAVEQESAQELNSVLQFGQVISIQAVTNRSPKQFFLRGDGFHEFDVRIGCFEDERFDFSETQFVLLPVLDLQKHQDHLVAKQSEASK